MDSTVQVPKPVRPFCAHGAWGNQPKWPTTGRNDIKNTECTTKRETKRDFLRKMTSANIITQKTPCSLSAELYTEWLVGCETRVKQEVEEGVSIGIEAAEEEIGR